MARDYTKYIVNNNSKPLSKRALALEIVKSYNTDSKPTFDKIKEIFPDEVQGSKGFIRKKSEEYDTKRFHEEALISSDNVKYLVSNQWGSKNISKLLKKGGILEIQIKEFKKQVETKIQHSKTQKKSPKDNNIKPKELNSTSSKGIDKLQIKNSISDEKEDPIIKMYGEIVDITILFKEYFLRKKSKNLDYMLGAYSLKFNDEYLSLELLNKKLKMFLAQLNIAIIFNRIMKNTKIIEIHKKMADHVEECIDDIVFTSDSYINRLLNERPDKRSKSDAIKSDEKENEKIKFIFQNFLSERYDKIKI
jgi:hypothetical protein